MRAKIGLLFVLILLFVFFAKVDGQDLQASPSNKAAKVKILKADFEQMLEGAQAPEGKTYLALSLEWENIHPKQKVKKRDLEGKPDRTMGVGGLASGGSQSSEEYVDADVAYMIPNFFDHAYCLADGKSYPLDKLTEKVPGGTGLNKSFAVEKLGDKKPVRLVYAVPEDAQNLAFQFFDYSYGHILIPIKGDLKLARGSEGGAGKALGQFKDNFIELAANKMSFQNEFQGEEGPVGWRYAVVELGGRSLSAGNIIQVEPKEYTWLQTKEGYLYYCGGATSTEDGYIRFTPEVYQSQTLGFLVPAGSNDFVLGMRIRNKVYTLNLGKAVLPEIPKAAASHIDGKTMEIMFFGMKKKDGKVFLDLGIKSLVNSGIEIQTADQFILKAGEEDISFDEEATSSGFHRPPEPFTIPPKSFVRFELVYGTEGVPTTLYYRGYESEGRLALAGLK